MQQIYRDNNNNTPGTPKSDLAKILRQQAQTEGAQNQNNNQQRRERTRCRDCLRSSIYIAIGFGVFWLEQALNLIVSLALIVTVISLIWVSIIIAVSTSFLWMPMCFICLPLLMTVMFLIKKTRLRDFCITFATRL